MANSKQVISSDHLQKSESATRCKEEVQKKVPECKVQDQMHGSGEVSSWKQHLRVNKSQPGKGIGEGHVRTRGRGPSQGCGRDVQGSGAEKAKGTEVKDKSAETRGAGPCGALAGQELVLISRALGSHG